MKWFVTHWSMLAWITGGIFTSLVFAEDEYREYRNMQEAVREQKAFNTDVDKRLDTFGMQQQRIDERTQIMLELLKKLDKQ